MLFPISQSISGLLPTQHVTWHVVLLGALVHVCSASSSNPLYLSCLILGREARDITAEKYVMLF